MFRSTSSRVVLGYILICLIWGSTWLAIKIGLESIPPFFGAAVRFLIATFISILIVWKGKSPIPLDKQSVYLYLTVGMCSFSIGFALVYWAQQYVPSGLASVLFATFPFFVAILSWYAVKTEKATFGKIAGVVLGFSGILIIFSEDISLHLGDASTVGMVLIIAAAIIQSVSAVSVKKYGGHISPFSLNAVAMGIGSLFLFICSFATEDLSGMSIDARAVGSVLYLSTFGSVVTFGTFFWLLKRMETVILSLSAFITPIIALILGIAVAGETMSGKILLGSTFVLGGILVANLRQLINVIRIKYNLVKLRNE